MKTNFLAVFLTLMSTISCSKVPQEIKQTVLYNEVINHYEKVDPHKQKKKAAVFLFQYMATKHSYYDQDVNEILTQLADSISQIDSLPEKNDIDAYLTRNAITSENPVIKKDYLHLKSSDLIKHIDITYNNWKNLSQFSEATFNDYCEYILPYRIKNEPFHKFSTKLFETNFKSFSDTLISSDSIIPAISSFIESIDCHLNMKLTSNYKNLLSTNQIYFIKVAPRCDDFVIFISQIFRALGIPATYDFTPQWGNHHRLGHSWLAIKWKQKWYAFEANRGAFLSEIYKNESIPKVFRKKYSYRNGGEILDVTSTYTKTINLQIDVTNMEGINTLIPAVAIFNKEKMFNVIDVGHKRNSDFLFENLGKSTVYFLGGLDGNRFEALSHPLYVDSCRNVTPLIPDYKNLKTYILHRKSPLSTNRFKIKLMWCKSPSGSWIEASSDNFRTIDTLLVFNNYNSYKEEYFSIKRELPYKMVRMCISPFSHLASLEFINQNGEVLRGTIIHNFKVEENVIKLFDNEMLTSFHTNPESENKYAGYIFNEPKIISKVSLHARNDGNHIIVGDQYELMVWDSGWQSLGEKIADKQELEYDNVPSGGYYWLKNHSRGIEEVPFMINDKGEQIWP